MKTATKYIFMAIIFEVLLAVITYSIIFEAKSLLYSFTIGWKSIVLSLIFVLSIAYIIGQKVNYTKMKTPVRKILGILYPFLLLNSFIFLLVLFKDIDVYTILLFNDSTFRLNDYFDIIVNHFYGIDFLIAATNIFGGLQTFLIGLWLGYKLSKITE